MNIDVGIEEYFALLWTDASKAEFTTENENAVKQEYLAEVALYGETASNVLL